VTGPEKILSSLIAVLVVLVVILGYQYVNTKDSIGEKEEYLNTLHEKQIQMYDNHIDSLMSKITTLQAEKEELTKIKRRVKIVTIREIDSIFRLPFTEQSDFWAKETARIDSIRRGYVSIDITE
jgi:CHASE3 domain sensor protein